MVRVRNSPAARGQSRVHWLVVGSELWVFGGCRWVGSWLTVAGQGNFSRVHPVKSVLRKGVKVGTIQAKNNDMQTKV